MRRDTRQALRSRVVFVNAPLERSESDSSARIGVSILREISIGTVQIFQYRYLSKYRYFWQHYPSILSLTGCITTWFGNSTAVNRKALQRVVWPARHIVGGELPSLQDIYTRWCIRKALRIIKDSSHPSHSLLSLLSSGRCLRSIRSRILLFYTL